MKRRSSILVFVGIAFAEAALAGEIRGRVIDASGAPVPNARVLAAESTVAQILYSSPKLAYAVSTSESDAGIASEGKLTGEAVADAEGRFVLADLRAARYSLLAIEPARGFAWHLDTAVGATLDLALTPPATVTGRVKGLRLDRTKHVVQLKPRAPLANIMFAPNIELAADDGFRFGPLLDVPGWNVLLTEWVLERGFSGVLVIEPVDVAAGKSAQVVVDLERGRKVSGVVRGARGEPLASVAVVAHSTGLPVRERGAVTGKDGAFTLRALADGEWTIEARRWTMRSTAGCGVGPKDVFASRTIVLGADDPGVIALEVPQLLGVPRLGDVVPDFEVTTIDGRVVSSAALRGKVVLIDFWATWCGLCRAEFPKLRETYARFGGGTKFEIVGVSIDEDPNAVRRLVKTLGLAWPQTALGVVEKNVLAQRFNIASTPSSFLIDREGKIVAINLLGDAVNAELVKLLPDK